LATMDRVVPWKEIGDLTESVYSKAGSYRRPYELSAIVRIHSVQQRFGLSYSAMREALYEHMSMRQFAGFISAREAVTGKVPIIAL